MTHRPQPRAHYDGKPSTPAVPTMPRHIAESPREVQLAWVLSQTGGATPPGAAEIDPARYARCEATREEARELAYVRHRVEVVGGPPAGYQGQGLFDAALPDSVLVQQALIVVRCDKLEAEFQNVDAPALFAEKAAAIEAAAAEAGAEYARINGWLIDLAQQAANDVRAATSNLPKPQRIDPDRTTEAKVQARIDALALQIHAVRARRQAAADASSAEMGRLAEAAADLLWRGPRDGNVPERPDVSHFYAAYDVVAEICGSATADEMWQTMEARWLDNGKWKTR